MNKKYLSGLVFLISVAVSLSTALVNKFPLVYPDTGSYIQSGFAGIFMGDRPIFYGLFLRVACLQSNLWFVVFAQALIVCYLVKKTLQIWLSPSAADIGLIAITTILAIFTGFSFNVSILIADVFSGICFLSVAVLLWHKSLTRLEICFLLLVFGFSVTTQIALLASGFVLIVFVFFLQRKAVVPARLPWLAGTYLVAALSIPAVHYMYSGKFRFTTAGHVFLMNHMLEVGILERYLDENCQSKNYKICRYKDSLGWDFIWLPSSPVYKTGGWEGNEKEYNEILRDIFTTPKHFVDFVGRGFEGTLKQLFTFETEVAAPQMAGSAPLGQISWRFGHLLREYQSSLQNNSKLFPSHKPLLEFPVGLVAMGFVMLLAVHHIFRREAMPGFKATCQLLLVFALVNAVICANLSTIDARYHNRVVWLFVLFGLIYAAQFLELKRKESSDKS